VSLRLLLTLLCFGWATAATAEHALKAAVFQVDATPPLGTPLCCWGNNGGAVEVTAPLSARGLVLHPAGQDPIVLCAVDWVGIGNESHDAWRMALANAVGTNPDRVAVHALHQHDAPEDDVTTDNLLDPVGLGGYVSNIGFTTDTMRRAAAAAGEALLRLEPVTHVGAGEGRVEKVASNRRIPGHDAKVRAVRYTATRDPAIRAEPEGTIDPMLKCVSFWNGDKPLAVMTYYATHPQSHYGKGMVNPDFVGMAREQRERALDGLVHLHFDGAGGNIGAGKCNDGSPENRPVFAARLAEGMRKAWEATTKSPLAIGDIAWIVEHVSLPLREETDTAVERQTLLDASAEERARVRAAVEIAFRERTQQGHQVPLTRLRLGNVDLLHMPGELFVEYQLAAQAMRPDRFVCMAAYGDYGMGYIGTAHAYGEGGYETQVYSSKTSPTVEKLLLGGIANLLEAQPRDTFPYLFPPLSELDNLPAGDSLLDSFQGRTEPMTTDEHRDLRERILHGFAGVTGALPHYPGPWPLDLKVVSEEETSAYVRRKITFSAGPEDRLSAWLLIPKAATAPMPAVLCLHQTTDIGKDEPAGLGENPDLDYAHELAERGYVAISPDYPTFGENTNIPDAYALGFGSITAKGIWNHRRALDLLANLPEVDPGCIGCIGHSLGGHNALFLEAVDTRIRAAVTSCGFSTFASYYDGDLRGWAQQRYMPRIETVYGLDPARMPFDFDGILAVIAPRGVFVSAPVSDANFALEGVKEAVDRARPVFDGLQAGDRLVAIHPEAEHSFPEAARLQAYEALDRWLSVEAK